MTILFIILVLFFLSKSATNPSAPTGGLFKGFNPSDTWTATGLGSCTAGGTICTSSVNTGTSTSVFSSPIPQNGLDTPITQSPVTSVVTAPPTNIPNQVCPAWGCGKNPIAYHPLFTTGILRNTVQ